MVMVFRFGKSIHSGDNAKRLSKTVLLQDTKHPLPTFTSTRLLQLVISTEPPSESEKQSFSISTLSNNASPFSTNCFTFFKDPFSTCSSFRLWYPVKSRISHSSLQLFAWIRITTAFLQLAMAAILLATTDNGNKAYHVQKQQVPSFSFPFSIFF